MLKAIKFLIQELSWLSNPFAQRAPQAKRVSDYSTEDLFLPQIGLSVPILHACCNYIPLL
jgi:hypothetical protein